jgi:hypothetical protein
VAYAWEIVACLLLHALAGTVFAWSRASSRPSSVTSAEAEWKMPSDLQISTKYHPQLLNTCCTG